METYPEGYKVVNTPKCCSTCSNYFEYLKYGDDIFDEACSLTNEWVHRNGSCPKWTDKYHV